MATRSTPLLASTYDTDTRPIDKFRSAVHKVMTLHRSAAVLSHIGTGAEPGVDPRRASMEGHYRTLHHECTIDVVDYSTLSVTSKKMANQEFVDWCQKSETRNSFRPSWVRVRWIHVAGISWDVIKALSLRHDLHPLALEDMLNGRPENLSKAEYFLNHLFLRILIHTVHTDTQSLPSTAESPLEHESEAHTPEAVRQRHLEQARLDALKRDAMTLRVSASPLFVFLFRDGTVFSFTQTTDSDLVLPIRERLRRKDTILRTSSDPSMLVQALISLVVDKAVEVIDAYQAQLAEIENKILVKPTTEDVRRLHIISGDLILHKRTLNPIKTLVYGLRRYDSDRCAALVDRSDPLMKFMKVVGFMSHKSKTYLAETFHNAEYILSTLESIAGIGDSLTDYTFNMASYSLNDTMRKLTIITIICLPLTFVAGYFGMNFTGVTWKSDWSDVLYWIISIPAVLVVFLFAVIPDIQRAVYYFKTRRLLVATVGGAALKHSS
uniref:Magnesium transporter n=1 Tax=Mycena chlorophos TaxID=658473 RepID=A0ABQ0L041_MYCCL|nr:predicted protein [Mycena chlorophos]